MPSANPGDPKEILKSLKLIHLAMMAGVLIFMLVALVLVAYSGPFAKFEPAAGQTIFLGFLLMAAILVSLAFLLHSRKCKNIAGLSLNDKLQVYRNSLILKFAMLEGSLFLGITTYLMTGLATVATVSGMIFLLLLLSRPATGQVISDLALDAVEAEALEDPT